MKKTKSRGRQTHLIGIVFGGITFLIILVSLLLIIRQSTRFIHPPHSILRWPFGLGKQYSESLEESEGARRVHGDSRNVMVTNVAGKIRIEGWGEDYCLVKYRKTGPTPRSIRELNFTIEQRGENLVIKRISSGKSLGAISFEIYIPNRVVYIYAESVSGSIDLARVHTGITQELRTVSGRISTDLSYDLSAESTSGSIAFQFEGKALSVKTVSGSIEGIISGIEPGASMKLSSVSGSIRISADEGFSTDASLRSISGGISCDFPMAIQRDERGWLEGKIGEGSGSLNIKTTSGAIRIGKI